MYALIREVSRDALCTLGMTWSGELNLALHLRRGQILGNILRDGDGDKSRINKEKAVDCRCSFVSLTWELTVISAKIIIPLERHAWAKPVIYYYLYKHAHLLKFSVAQGS